MIISINFKKINNYKNYKDFGVTLFEKLLHIFEQYLIHKIRTFYNIAVSKENDIFQIAKKPIRDGRLALPDLKNEFC
jgi:inorganic pyrophosphatase